MARTFDDVRNDHPEWAEYNDVQLTALIAAKSGVDLETVANTYGMDLPSSDLGKSLQAGWEGVKAGYAQIADEFTPLDTSGYIEDQQYQQALLGMLNQAPQSWEEVEGLQDIPAYVGHLGAQSLPYMADLAVGGIAGGVLKGAKAAKLGLNAADAARMTQRGAMGGAFIGGYPTALGDVFSSQYEQTGERDVGYALPAAAGYSALNLLGIESLGIRGLTGNLGRGLTGSRLKNTGIMASGTAGMESIGETGQEILNQYGRQAVDPEYDPMGPEAMAAYKESAIAGGLLGAVPGGVGGLLQRTRAKTQLPEISPDESTNLLQPTEPAQGDLFTGEYAPAPYPPGWVPPPVEQMNIYGQPELAPEYATGVGVDERQTEMFGADGQVIAPFDTDAQRQALMRGGNQYGEQRYGRPVPPLPPAQGDMFTERPVAGAPYAPDTGATPLIDAEGISKAAYQVPPRHEGVVRETPKGIEEAGPTYAGQSEQRTEPLRPEEKDYGLAEMPKGEQVQTLKGINQEINKLKKQEPTDYVLGRIKELERQRKLLNEEVKQVLRKKAKPKSETQVEFEQAKKEYTEEAAKEPKTPQGEMFEPAPLGAEPQETADVQAVRKSIAAVNKGVDNLKTFNTATKGARAKIKGIVEKAIRDLGPLPRYADELAAIQSRFNLNKRSRLSSYKAEALAVLEKVQKAQPGLEARIEKTKQPVKEKTEAEEKYGTAPEEKQITFLEAVREVKKIIRQGLPPQATKLDEAKSIEKAEAEKTKEQQGRKAAKVMMRALGNPELRGKYGEMADAMKALFQRMSANNVKAPAAFVNKKTAKALKELYVNSPALVKKALSPEAMDVLNSLTGLKQKTVSATAAENAAKYGVRQFGQKIITVGLPKRKQVKQNTEGLAAIKRAESKLEREHFFVNSNWGIISPTTKPAAFKRLVNKIVESLNKLNYPNVDEFKNAKTSAELDTAYSKYNQWRKTEDALIAVGGFEAEYQLGETKSIIRAFETARWFKENTLTQGQKEAAVASGVNIPGVTTPAANEVIEVTNYIGEINERVNSDSYEKGLNTHQRKGVNLALEELLNGNKKFLLADAPGFGKTRQILAVANEYAKATKKKVLIAHPGKAEGDIYQQFVKDAEAMGIDPTKFDYVTYGYLNQNNVTGAYGLVIWDEAHALKNKNSLWHKRAVDLNTDAMMYTTATPSDTVKAMYILADLQGITIDDFVKSLGLVPKNNIDNVDVIEDFELAPGQTHINASVEIAERFQLLGELGKLIRRQYPQRALPERIVVEPSAKAKQIEQKLLSIADQVVNTDKFSEALYYTSEYGKLDGLLNEIKAEVKEGKKVVVVVRRHSGDSEYSLRLKDGTTETIIVPDIAKPIYDALNKANIGFQSYVGGTRQDLSRFQKGDVPVIITTLEKGGVGVNLDDQIGGAPRSLIVTQLPWSAIQWDQVLGRIDRQTTKSTPTKRWLDAGMEGDRRSENVLRMKIRMQNAATIGVPEVPEYIRMDSAYTVNRIPASRGKKPKLQVALNTTDETKALAKIFREVAGAKAYRGTFWELTETQWEKIEPRIITAMQAMQPKAESITTNIDPDNLADDTIQAVRDGAGSELTTVLIDINNKLPKGHKFKTLINRLIELGLKTEVVGIKDGKRSYFDTKIRLGSNNLRTFLHEAVHAATMKAIDNATPAQRAELERIYKMVQKQLGTDGEFTQANYGTKDVYEFVAEVFTNPTFQKALSKLKPDGSKLSIWQRVINFVKRLLKLGTVPNPVLDQALKISEQFLQGPTVSSEAAVRSINRRLYALGEGVGGVSAVAERLSSVSPVATNVLDKLRTNVKLPLMTQRQLGESYHDYFLRNGKNLIAEYNSLIGFKDRATRMFQRAGEYLYRDMVEEENINPEATKEMYDIMGEASLAEFVMGTNVKFEDDVHKHLHGKDKAAHRKNFEALKARWDALHESTKAVYERIRDFYKNEWDYIVDKITSNVIDASEIEWATYRAKDLLTMSTKDFKAMVDKDVADHIANENLDKEAAKKVRRLAETFKNNITEIKTRSRVRGDYFPLKRFGDWVVEARGEETVKTFDTLKEARDYAASLRAKDPGTFTDRKEVNGKHEVTSYDRIVEFHETYQQAEKARAELKADYKTVMKVQKKSSYKGESFGISPDIIKRVESKLNDKRAVAAMKAAFIQMMPETSIHKAQLRRRGVKGYSKDMKRAFASHVKASSHYKSQLIYGRQLADAMDEIKKHAREYHEDQPLRRDVAQELVLRDDLDIMEMTPNKYLDNATNVGFIWYLFSPSYWFVNATQPALIAGPWLNAHTGGGGIRALGRAYDAIFPEIKARTGKVLKGMNLQELSDFLEEGGELRDDFKQRILKSDKYTPAMRKELIAMLESLGETGLIDMTFAADLRTAAEGEGGAGTRLINKTLEWARIMPHLVEILNRSTTAMAAYELGRKKGMSAKEATGFAERAVASTQFDYSAANKARYFSERNFKLARPILMFMQHSQHMYYMLLRSLAVSSKGLQKKLRGETLTADERAEVKEAGKLFAGITASHALAAGAIGATFEPIKWAIGMAAWAFGDDDEPWQFDVAVQQFMADVFGEELGQVAAKGLPAAVAADFTSRLGLHNLLFFDNSNSEEGKTALALKIFELLGPLGAMAGNAADATVAFERGDYFKGYEKMMPKLVRDFIRTGNMAKHGVRDASGKTLIPSDDVSPYELFLQSMGFAPNEVSRMYARRNAIKNVETAYTDKRNRLLEKFHRAENSKERAAVREEIREYNAKVPARKLRITQESLMRSRKKRKEAQRAMERNKGVYLQDTRREFAKYGEF